MAVIYSDAVKTTRMGAVNTALATGFLVIGTGTSAGVTGVMATIPLAATAGTVSTPIAGTVQLALTTAAMTATATGAGTPTFADLLAANGTTKVATGLTVGVGQNVVLSAATIAVGNTVTVTSAILTHG
jgi:hypothetical protein